MNHACSINGIKNMLSFQHVAPFFLTISPYFTWYILLNLVIPFYEENHGQTPKQLGGPLQAPTSVAAASVIGVAVTETQGLQTDPGAAG